MTIKKLHQLSLCVALMLFCSCKNDSPKSSPKSVNVPFTKEGLLKLKTFNDSLIKTLDIEIADDEYTIQTGLMYRNEMKEYQAMLFIFPEEADRHFYMKNTRIPLDIIYIAKDSTIVSFQKNAKPFDETSLPSGMPAKYVLEINGGLAEAWSLKVGDKIHFKSL